MLSTWPPLAQKNMALIIFIDSLKEVSVYGPIYSSTFFWWAIEIINNRLTSLHLHLKFNSNNAQHIKGNELIYS